MWRRLAFEFCMFCGQVVALMALAAVSGMCAYYLP